MFKTRLISAAPLVAALTFPACDGASRSAPLPSSASIQAQSTIGAAAAPCMRRTCIYVIDTFKHNPHAAVLAFDADANGDAPPLLRIGGPKTLLQRPSGLAVDAERNIYVASLADQDQHGTRESITEYAAGADGDASPIRRIDGSRTRLSYPFGVAVGSGGDVYVANYGNSFITMYSPGKDHDTDPTRTIYGPGLTEPLSVAIDDAHTVFATDLQYENGESGAVVEYAAGANGEVTPIRTITGVVTQLKAPWGIALDSSGVIYVANLDNPGSITEYARNAHGNASPIRIISGGHTLLAEPTDVALDAQNKLYVVNRGGRSINVYAAGASGDVAPMRIIAGPGTDLIDPQRIVVR
jgi:hypothetical protein